MTRKKHTPEQIVTKLRQAEALRAPSRRLSQGRACPPESDSGAATPEMNSFTSS
jgi:hypothetical protein